VTVNGGQGDAADRNHNVSPVIRCADCGATLKAEDDACPECGSRNRRIKATLKAALESREFIRMKAKEGGRGKPFLEIRSGDSLFRKTGVWNRIHRIIDRKNDRYYERIEDQSGNVIRLCDEPLSQHRGHGSAKKKQNSRPDTEVGSEDTGSH